MLGGHLIATHPLDPASLASTGPAGGVTGGKRTVVGAA